jgi:hypothetical protein
MSSRDFVRNASRLKPPIPHNIYLGHLSLSGCIVFRILDMPRLLWPFNARISPTIELDDMRSSRSISPDIFASGSPAVKLPDTNAVSNGDRIYLNISGGQELPIIPLALMLFFTLRVFWANGRLPILQAMMHSFPVSQAQILVHLPRTSHFSALTCFVPHLL